MVLDAHNGVVCAFKALDAVNGRQRRFFGLFCEVEEFGRYNDR